MTSTQYHLRTQMMALRSYLRLAAKWNESSPSPVSSAERALMSLVAGRERMKRRLRSETAPLAKAAYPASSTARASRPTHHRHFRLLPAPPRRRSLSSRSACPASPTLLSSVSRPMRSSPTAFPPPRRRRSSRRRVKNRTGSRSQAQRVGNGAGQSPSLPT